MQIAQLTDYGIAEIIVESWRRNVGEELLPVQQHAVYNGLLEGKNLLICAPTSSGKTFCGELAAAKIISHRKKVLFLVPLKSIAEEKYHDFVLKYQSLGARVVISTHDHNEFDQQLEKGEFDLGVMIYEKFNQLLIKNIDLLAAIDLILVDEIQMIAEAGRGAILELLLLKILRSKYTPQLIALSAVLQNMAELAEWLNCRLLQDNCRPVELRQGVLANGCYYYRTFNSRQKGEEQFLSFEGDSEQLLQINIEHLVNHDEQVLVFLKSRHACEQLASLLAEDNLWQAAVNTIEAIRNEPKSIIGEKLRHTLQAAIAFHHADLSFSQRRLLEEGFRNGEIRVLVCTTTLALGVNLPAQSVFIDCYKYKTGEHSGKSLIVPLSWNEYEGMSGRAGRYAHGQSWGRSILVAESALEKESLWKIYIEGQPERLVSQLALLPLADICLDLISSQAVNNIESLQRIVEKSFYSYQGQRFSEDALCAQIENLATAKLIFIKNEQFLISPLGRLLSLHGLSIASGKLIIDFCREYQAFDPLSWLYFSLQLPDAATDLLYLNYAENYKNHYRRLLIEYAAEQSELSRSLRKLTTNDYMMTERKKKQLKGALLLQDWIGNNSTAKLERKFKVNIGTILHIAESCSWLLDTTSALAKCLNLSQPLITQIDKLAKAVQAGFDLPDTILPQLGLNAEQRDYIWRLYQAGFTAATDFCNANKERIKKITGKELAETLVRKFENNNNKQEVHKLPKLKIRGQREGEKMLVNFSDIDMSLTAKSFNYLFKLMAACLLKKDGWLDKEEIEPGFNQAKNIYRVKQELKRFASGLEGCIENNKTGSYRLNIQPEQIMVDFDGLVGIDDLELVGIAQQLKAQLAA